MTSNTISCAYEDQTDLSATWINWFCNLRGNEFYCAVDAEYIADSFNLTGLPKIIGPLFKMSLDTILDSMPQSDQDDGIDTNPLTETAATLYGLIHARYILSAEGIEKMKEKYHRRVFGKCPRHFCDGQHVLPIGLSDQLNCSVVKTYCPSCCDVYVPRSGRSRDIDGAVIGTSFPHMFFMANPALRPSRPKFSYVPKLYGFKIQQSMN